MASTISVVTAPGTTFSACAASSSCAPGSTRSPRAAATRASRSVGVRGRRQHDDKRIRHHAGAQSRSIKWNVRDDPRARKEPGRGRGRDPEHLDLEGHVACRCELPDRCSSGGLIQGAFPNAGAASTALVSFPPICKVCSERRPRRCRPSSDWIFSTTHAGAVGRLRRQLQVSPDGRLVDIDDEPANPGLPLVLGADPAHEKRNGVVAGRGEQGLQHVLPTDGHFAHPHRLGECAWLRLGYEFDNSRLQGALEPVGDREQHDAKEGYFARQLASNRDDHQCRKRRHCFKSVWNPDGYAFLGANDQEYLKSGGFLLDPRPGPRIAIRRLHRCGCLRLGAQPHPTGVHESRELGELHRPATAGAPNSSPRARACRSPFPKWGVMALPRPPFPGMNDDPGYINGMYCFMTNPARECCSGELLQHLVHGLEHRDHIGGSFPTPWPCSEQDFGQGSTAAC